MNCQSFCKEQINNDKGLFCIIDEGCDFRPGRQKCPLGFTNNPKKEIYKFGSFERTRKEL